MQPNSHYLKCCGREIHFVEWGRHDAPPLILWHGLARTCRDFDDLAIALADEYGVAVMPHCFYYGPGLLATAHVVATLPETAALEVPWLQWPNALHPYQHVAPRMVMPAVAGLGFQPDLEILRKFTIDSALIM